MHGAMQQSVRNNPGSRRTPLARVQFSFLDPGRPALLNRILAHREERRGAVIVHGGSDLDVDASPLEEEVMSGCADRNFVELSHGCSGRPPVQLRLPIDCDVRIR